LPDIDSKNGRWEIREERLMAMVVKCRDIGVDCDFTARGQNEQEVMKACAEHASKEHGMQEIPAELAAKVKAAIREEKAA
jgi:predicted small metal-binding protein